MTYMQTKIEAEETDTAGQKKALTHAAAAYKNSAMCIRGELSLLMSFI